MSRRRPTWPELPARMRRAIEERLGSGVVDWTSHDAGYSLTSTCSLGLGVFVLVRGLR